MNKHKRSMNMTAMAYLSMTLRDLKKLVKKWALRQKKKMKNRIVEIRKERSTILKDIEEGRR